MVGNPEENSGTTHRPLVCDWERHARGSSPLHPTTLRPSTALANRRRFRPSRQAQRRRHPTPSAGERGGSRAGRAGFRDAVPFSPPWPPEAPRPAGSASFLSLPSFLSFLATEEQRESGPAEHVPT